MWATVGLMNHKKLAKHLLKVIIQRNIVGGVVPIQAAPKRRSLRPKQPPAREPTGADPLVSYAARAS